MLTVTLFNADFWCFFYAKGFSYAEGFLFYAKGFFSYAEGFSGPSFEKTRESLSGMEMEASHKKTFLNLSLTADASLPVSAIRVRPFKRPRGSVGHGSGGLTHDLIGKKGLRYVVCFRMFFQQICFPRIQVSHKFVEWRT